MDRITVPVATHVSAKVDMHTLPISKTGKSHFQVLGPVAALQHSSTYI